MLLSRNLAAYADYFPTPVGPWKTGREILKGYNQMPERILMGRIPVPKPVIGIYVQALLDDPRFRTSMSADERAVIVRPRDLGFLRKELPATLCKRALERGLKLCPDDFAFRHVLRSIRQSTLLYMVRDITPGYRTDSVIRVSSFDGDQRGIGLWDADHPVGPDTDLCFVL